MSGLRCYLCGSTQSITRDHVPPKNLFPKPRPSNLVTVPCCYKCNNRYSKEDEYFRLAVCCPINANQLGKTMWDAKVMRNTVKKRRIGPLVDEIVRTLKPAILRTPLGDIHGTQIHVDANMVKSVLIRITKGLLSIVHPEVERDNLTFEVIHINRFKLHSIVTSGVASHFTPYVVGDGVYRHWRALAKEDTHNGIWVHMFYDAATWMVRHARKP